MMDKDTEKKPEPRSGSGNSTGTYYKIEVRSTFEPKVLTMKPPARPFVIDKQWREWPLTLAAGELHPSPSVPTREWDRHAGEHGLMSYEAAQAHQWALIAFLDAGFFPTALSIETRLVAVKFSESYSTEELGVSEPLERPHRPSDTFKLRAE